ncbi:MAG: CxxC-x17-CxxC domain-containing protein [Candidatus Magasanikbacteria bacterium]
MSAFDKNKKFGGNKFGKKSFGGGSRGGFSGGSRGGFGGGRDRGERPAMHEATCSECGQTCEVPFLPTGDRPVFCSKCFQNQRGQSAPRREDNGFGAARLMRNDKQMHEATCAKCGNKCEVPFNPIPGKPVYCTACFEKPGTTILKNVESFKDQFELLNSKLDKIIQALSPATVTEKKAVAETKTLAKKANKKKK